MENKISQEQFISPEERIRELEQKLSEASERETFFKAKIESLEKELEREREKGEHDSLTGLYNRGFLEEKAQKMIERINFTPKEERREDHPSQKMSMVFIDVDNFKFINDNFGHEAGDAVLKEISKILKIHTRGDSDIAARLGGEEFIAFMPGANEAIAKERAEQFRDLIRTFKVKIPSGGFIPITVSIGVAELKRGETFAQLLDRSDETMYFAKNHGKDQVSIASEIPKEEL